jgi:hypothetical protein
VSNARLARALLRSALLASTLSLAIAGPAFARDVTGTVVDASGTRSLNGAELRIIELNRVAQANRMGASASSTWRQAITL